MSEINEAAVEAEALDAATTAARMVLADAPEASADVIAQNVTRAVLAVVLPHLAPEPRVITTAEEMEALPIGSVVLDLHGDAGLIDGLGPKGRILFAETAPMALSSATKHYAPFTVLYNPEGDRP